MENMINVKSRIVAKGSKQDLDVYPDHFLPTIVRHTKFTCLAVTSVAKIDIKVTLLKQKCKVLQYISSNTHKVDCQVSQDFLIMLAMNLVLLINT